MRTLKRRKQKYTLCKSCTIKSIISMNLVSFESLLNLLLDANKIIFFKSRQDVPFVVLGHIYTDVVNAQWDLFCKILMKNLVTKDHFKILFRVSK